jgi:hypothetical protein
VPPAKVFKFTLVAGQSIGLRAIGFLESDTDQTLNGQSQFEALKPVREREVRTRFDFWISGGRNPRLFHGWPDLTKYKECFTFKWRENRQHQRLYGFLHHPKPKSRPRFQLCVLVYFDTKNEDETDFSILNDLNQLRKDSFVIAAISKEFPEERSTKTQWIQ